MTLGSAAGVPGRAARTERSPRPPLRGDGGRCPRSLVCGERRSGPGWALLIHLPPDSPHPRGCRGSAGSRAQEGSPGRPPPQRGGVALAGPAVGRAARALLGAGAGGGRCGVTRHPVTAGRAGAPAGQGCNPAVPSRRTGGLRPQRCFLRADGGL